MKYVILNSFIVASSILGIAHTVSAESLVNAVTDPNGTVYQVDLDNRSEYYTDSGWRHVKFWLSTKGDVKKHSAIASCSPYDIKSEYYEFDWRPNGGGYPEGTVAGNIARVACNN
ncbi:hypothetical protein IQ247_10170 [Plectonema cf. radiosum LEGE 06105]|uniref:Uncharacterized protein n=1 Tax=Plectonema cf. radiosum LEGE 06105 TaxID=945769 RepID=A0A8J7F7L8_9CYAN|nr:hypothetical protein [Plectonema radiosum]MBE9213034.1 hypothetical protein [Plectonema cf. radiosum LEGE 06105]